MGCGSSCPAAAAQRGKTRAKIEALLGGWLDIAAVLRMANIARRLVLVLSSSQPLLAWVHGDGEATEV